MQRRGKSQPPVWPVRRRYTNHICARLLLVSLCSAIFIICLSFTTGRNLRAAASLSNRRAIEKRPSAIGKGKRSPDGLWQQTDESDMLQGHAGLRAVPPSYRMFHLNQAERVKLLRRAPLEFTKAARIRPLIVTLPMPDGTFQKFTVEESPVMERIPAARFPQIKTYSGQGIDDPTATARFSSTPQGFHAIVLSANGTVLIEPVARGETNTYVSHKGLTADPAAASMECVVSDSKQSLRGRARNHPTHSRVITNTVTGSTLRTYRLALAATAEYTQIYGGGTVSGGLAAVTTTLNLANAVFERDVAIRLVLVANEASIIFTNAATDGYTHNNADTLLVENQSRLDAIIGSANYDIGHVLDGQDFRPSNLFYFQGRGNGRACVSGQKAKGVSILRLLEPASTTAVWELLHEMGHQFGASHTFNGTTANCLEGRAASTAYEPGSGSTNMGYRGTVATGMPYLQLCFNEDLRSTDTYYHTASIEQIVDYTTFGQGNVCAGQIETGNNPPNVNAGAVYTIPQNTPFTLTATGSDPDGDALTYCWEEFDLGAPSPPNTDDGSRPIFRSFAPTISPSRTFPQLSDILSGTSTFGESLPVTTRMMNFRVTARDNHSSGGGVNTSATFVNVYSGSGAFTVTQPSSSATWAADSTQTVTWDVANTSNAPVNCASVRISLSTDGGNTFPFILLSSTPNNGSATITVPRTPSLTARVKVEAVGNIFFNISPQNFTITAPSGITPPTLLTEANTNRAIALDSVTFMRDAFPFLTMNNFSADRCTRLILFAVNLDLKAGEDVSVVSAQAEDAGQKIYPLQVEYVGKVPNFDWLTQIVVKLPDAIAGAGDVWVSINSHGAVSNKAIVSIK